MTQPLYLIEVGGYIINPDHIAYIKHDVNMIAIFFAVVGQAPPIILRDADSKRFLELLASRSVGFHT